jgi:hypothetical protein
MRTQSIFACIICSILSPAATASAQSDVSIGYQYLRLSVSGEAVNLPQGFGVQYGQTIATGWQAVGVFGWAGKNDAGQVDAFALTTRFTQITLGGGIRREFRTRTNAHPFVQAVVGVARSSFRFTSNGALGGLYTSNDLLVEPGAGLASVLAGRIGIFGEVDYRTIWPDANSEIYYSDDNVRGLRLLIGVRVKLQ